MNSSLLDGELDRGDVADVGRDGLLEADAAGREHAQRPVAGGGEEAEAAVIAERDLGHELVAGAEQARVAGGNRVAAGPQHVPLDDRLLARLVLGDRHSASGRAAGIVAHLPSPISIGTPTSEPYSVHDPS